MDWSKFMDAVKSLPVWVFAAASVPTGILLFASPSFQAWSGLSPSKLDPTAVTASAFVFWFSFPAAILLTASHLYRHWKKLEIIRRRNTQLHHLSIGEVETLSLFMTGPSKIISIAGPPSSYLSLANRKILIHIGTERNIHLFHRFQIPEWVWVYLKKHPKLINVKRRQTPNLNSSTTPSSDASS